MTFSPEDSYTNNLPVPDDDKFDTSGLELAPMEGEEPAEKSAVKTEEYTAEEQKADEERFSVVERPQPIGREALTSKLKAKSFNLLEISRYLINGQDTGWARDVQVDQNGDTLLKPFTWNENSGVILFNDGEKTYVTRSTDELRNELFRLGNEYKKDERIGVPHVNDSGVWKDKYAWNDFAEKW